MLNRLAQDVLWIVAVWTISVEIVALGVPGADNAMKNDASNSTAGPSGRRSHRQAAAVDENLQEIKTWEQTTLDSRSKTERLADWIAYTAASGPVLLFHVVWFTAWISINLGWLPGVTPFDPFPFPFLTMTVSLEAIFLALFVLASQNRLARQADKRSHLDLQINLLAEREMTAVIQLLRDIAAHLDVRTTVTPEQLNDLGKKTNIHTLTNRLEEFAAGTKANSNDAGPRDE